MKVQRMCAVMGLAAFVAASTMAADAPATRPETAWNEMISGGKKAAFTVWQDGAEVKRSGDEAVHLRGGPFELHISGDVDHVFVVASQESTLADALEKGNVPAVEETGTGGAFDAGDLLISESPAVASWDAAKGQIFGNDAATQAKTEESMKNNLGALPVVLDTTIQPIGSYATNGAREYTFSVKTLHTSRCRNFDMQGNTDMRPLEWDGVQKLTLVMCVGEKTPDGQFERLGWKRVTLVFDGK